MKITLQQYESIQRYLDGDMPPGEAQDFERQLETDPVLREHTLFEQEFRTQLEYIQQEVPGGNNFDDPLFIRSLIKDAAKEENIIKNDLLAPEKGMPARVKALPRTRAAAKPAAKIISFTLLVSIAAAACLIMAIVLPFLFVNPDQRQDTALREKAVTPAVEAPSAATAHAGQPVTPPDTAAAGTMARAGTAPDVFEKYYGKAEPLAAAVQPQLLPDLLVDPVTAYKKARYGPIQKFDPDDYIMMGAGEEEDDDKNGNQSILEWGRFYRGLSYIKTGNHNGAARDLKWVISNTRNNRQLAVKAQLFLALVHIKQKDTAQAIPLLEKLSNNKSKEAAPFKKQAKELLTEINK